MPSAEAQSSTVSWVDAEDITKIDAVIKTLISVEKYDTDTEHNDQDFTIIVNFYQEQPHVLDPHLQPWIGLFLYNSCFFLFIFAYSWQKNLVKQH